MPNRDVTLLLNITTRLGPQLLLVSAVLLTPWFRGGVDERVQIVLFGMLLLATTGVFAGRFSSRSEHSPATRMPWATLPVFVGLLLGMSQLTTLPRGLVALVSPQSVQLRELPLADAKDGDLLARNTSADVATTSAHEPDALRTAAAGRPQGSWYTISLRPTATWYDLALLILAAAAFSLAWQLFSTRREIRTLCLLVAINGAALALFGIIQRLTWNGRFYWIGPRLDAGLPFAAFVNRNNAGGYLNLCLAAGVVVMLWAMNRRRNTKGTRPSSRNFPMPRHFAKRPAWKDRLRETLLACDSFTLASICLTSMILSGVLCSLSRGAGVGLFAATVVAFGVAILSHRSYRSGGFGLVIAGGMGLVGWVGMYDSMLQRLETLQDGEKLAADGRIPNWLDALRGVPDFWLTGSGLGTYRDIYLLQQQRYDPGWFYYAENQYLQSLVEGGVPALAILLAAIGMVAMACWRLALRAATPTDFALGVGGVFALASQAVCGFFDFGLYIPANMVLMAVLCGVITGRAANFRTTAGDVGRLGVSVPRGLQASLVGLLVVGLGMGGWQHWTLETTKQVLNDVGYSKSAGSARTDEIRQALTALTARAMVAPRNEELHYDIARAYIYLYRVQVLEQLRETAPPTVSLAELWDQASTTKLHHEAQEIVRLGDGSQLDALRSRPLVREALVPALRHLEASRACCPILPKTHLHLARICFIEPGGIRDEPYLQRACELAPSNPVVFRTAGLLDIQAGRIQQACSRWRHALTLTITELDFILQQCKLRLPPETIVESVLPPSPQLILDLVNDPNTPETWRELLLQRAERVSREAELPEAEMHFFLGRTFALSGQHENALLEFERATELRPRQLDWRYQYGQLLFQMEHYDHAAREILFCARRQPGNAAFRRLMQEIRDAEVNSKIRPKLP